jgi:cell division protein FtsI/penicillin-binding protein 2
MNFKSPLLQRARRATNRRGVKFPRRGRIRIGLGVIILGGCIWMFSSHSMTTEKDPHEAALPKKKTEEPDKNRAKGGWFGPRHLGSEEVAEILKRHPSRLMKACDTIRDDGRSLVFHYSVDSSLQSLGMTLLNRYHPMYGAIVALDPVSGRVLSLLSYTNPDSPPLGNDLYCRSLFPAASVFKTITAAAAMETQGLKPESLLRMVGARHTLYKSQLAKELPGYSNEVTLDDAFAYSINPIFGRIGIYMLGADGLRDYTKKFGFNTPLPFDLPNDPPVTQIEDSSYTLAELASGFNQKTIISPLYGALLASSITNKGIMPTPGLVDSVTDLETGTLLYRGEPRLWRMPISPRTASQLEQCMQSVARYGTARKSFRYLKQSHQFNSIFYGGKTGSIDKKGVGRVDWFIGFARHSNDPTQHIATGIVTVHGSNWTVHSSYLAAEIMRTRIRAIQVAENKAAEQEKEPEAESSDIAIDAQAEGEE